MLVRKRSVPSLRLAIHIGAAQERSRPSAAGVRENGMAIRIPQAIPSQRFENQTEIGIQGLHRRAFGLRGLASAAWIVCGHRVVSPTHRVRNTN